MQIRFLIIFLVVTTINLNAAWYDKVHPRIEAGMHLAEFGGTLSNSASTPTEFNRDFGYSEAYASYFALNLEFDYDYVPNVEISYFTVEQNQDVALNKTIAVASSSYTDLIATQINYSVLSVILSKEFKSKGRLFSVFGKKFYPGDVKYSIGVNVKAIDWYFQIINRNTTTSDYDFDRVQSLIFLPYFGFKYFYYDFSLYTSISTLSVTVAKATNYEIGIDYNVIDNLYLSASYMYEDFQAVEKRDNIDFSSSGNKFSFKYKF